MAVHHRSMVLVTLVLLQQFTHGFVTRFYPSPRSAFYLSTQEFADEEETFYNDFEGWSSIGEDSSNTPTSSVLQDRLDQVQTSERRQSALQNRNWKLANWMENCIKLDDEPILSCLAHDDHDSLWVGRADGSVVQLHTEPVVEVITESHILFSQSINYMDAMDDILVASSGGGSTIAQLDVDTNTTSVLEHPSGSVLFLKLLESSLLVSASRDSVAVWNSETGVLLGSIALDLEDVLCFDSDTTHVYVGAQGTVFIFKLSDIQNSKQNCVGQFQANQENRPVTALAVGEETTLGGRQTAKSVFVGDSVGSLKQFFVFGKERLESFPKMASQRLPKKAHLFQGTNEAVRSILVIDAAKVVCADDTGLRAYSTSTGKELFRMEGFETLRSICLFQDKLYTDGMKGFISIHDFTIEEGDDFELEMPEYRS